MHKGACTAESARVEFAPTRAEALDDVDSGDEGVIARFVAGEADVPQSEATSRLACVDLEWERIRAVDIFAARVASAHRPLPSPV